MNRDHYAVVAGITRYPGVNDLQSPVMDARMFRDWLVDPLGGQLPKEHVKTITTKPTGTAVTDPYLARPIKRQIDHALELIHTEVNQAVEEDPQRWENTRLYLYVSGHGIMPGRGDAALLLADARPGRYENLELRSYVDWYRNCAVFREVVVFADCCRTYFRLVEPSTVGFDVCSRPKERVRTLVGYAAGPDDPAYEERELAIDPDKRRGYFTRALVDGLRRARNDPAFNAVTSVTLAEYVAVAVLEATRGRPVPQQVEMPSDAGHPIVFSSARGQETGMVTIRFPSGWTAPVDLLQGTVRTTYDPTVGPWTLPLPPGAYAVVRCGTFDGAPFADGGMFMAAIGGSCVIQL
ncbi:caspase family protein [Streptomyces sp. NBC_01262]|uniref:caspase family protein n=1 Tax=Streptomyces sp. NBC_01262 TaxID=2903803 RepID=UPI002E32689D|nr:caspase family protein [Streptomyces sp. NBC_01262]